MGPSIHSSVGRNTRRVNSSIIEERLSFVERRLRWNVKDITVVGWSQGSINRQSAQDERASKFLFSFKLCRCTRLARKTGCTNKSSKSFSNKISNKYHRSDIILGIISFARKKNCLSISMDQNDGLKFSFFFLKRSLISSSLASRCSRLVNVLSARHFFIFQNKKESRSRERADRRREREILEDKGRCANVLYVFKLTTRSKKRGHQQITAFKI